MTEYWFIEYVDYCISYIKCGKTFIRKYKTKSRLYKTHLCICLTTLSSIYQQYHNTTILLAKYQQYSNIAVYHYNNIAIKLYYINMTL